MMIRFFHRVTDVIGWILIVIILFLGSLVLVLKVRDEGLVVTDGKMIPEVLQGYYCICQDVFGVCRVGERNYVSCTVKGWEDIENIKIYKENNFNKTFSGPKSGL